MHRAQAAVLAALAPRPTGPPPTPPGERIAMAELARLRRRNARLEEQLRAMDSMLGAAGEIIRHLRGLPPRTSASCSPRSPRARRGAGPAAQPPTSAASEDPEPPPPATARPTPPPTRASTLADPVTEALPAAVTEVAAMPDHRARAARALGVKAATLRRWLGRLARGVPLCRRRGGRRAPIPPAHERAVRACVRELGGMVGAASLAHSVEGVSRRSASDLKRDELAVIERERQAACARVHVTTPGVIRGFDAMHVGAAYVLVAADAAVPYRTSLVGVPRYDADAVAATLAADFARHGAPLVLRCDRARCHDAPAVMSVLRAHGVLALHGPPHHPCYYGQLERQNREHRAWLTGPRTVSACDLEAMRSSLNGRWRRPTLHWHTADEIWRARCPPTDDRDELHAWVQTRAARLRVHGLADDLALRLAIEQALIERGYLLISTRPTLLCE